MDERRAVPGGTRSGRGGVTAGRVGRVVQVSASPGGVPKRAVDRACVGPLGLEGDGHRQPQPVHGGFEQAVCLYTVEAITRVAADGHTAFPGAYGENLTVEGIEVGLLARGDRLAIGDGGLELEITRHAAPCQTIAHFFDDRAIARISPKVHPADARQYARVITEGPVAPGDRVEVLTAAG